MPRHAPDASLLYVSHGDRSQDMDSSQLAAHDPRQAVTRTPDSSAPNSPLPSSGRREVASPSEWGIPSSSSRGSGVGGRGTSGGSVIGGGGGGAGGVGVGVVGGTGGDGGGGHLSRSPSRDYPAPLPLATQQQHQLQLQQGIVPDNNHTPPRDRVRQQLHQYQEQQAQIRQYQQAHQQQQILSTAQTVTGNTSSSTSSAVAVSTGHTSQQQQVQQEQSFSHLQHHYSTTTTLPAPVERHFCQSTQQSTVPPVSVTPTPLCPLPLYNRYETATNTTGDQSIHLHPSSATPRPTASPSPPAVHSLRTHQSLPPSLSQ